MGAVLHRVPTHSSTKTLSISLQREREQFSQTRAAGYTSCCSAPPDLQASAKESSLLKPYRHRHTPATPLLPPHRRQLLKPHHQHPLLYSHYPQQSTTSTHKHHLKPRHCLNAYHYLHSRKLYPQRPRLYCNYNQQSTTSTHKHCPKPLHYIGLPLPALKKTCIPSPCYHTLAPYYLHHQRPCLYNHYTPKSTTATHKHSLKPQHCFSVSRHQL